ncbi:MAG TPA: HAMP domain-containing sensor histidine kinase [Polyangiaceae bacterium]|nr:HAMP domain-containing sensor histidine kinase [Polyangiaceae bacterium]
MLHDFIIAHRDRIIERARGRVRERTLARATDSKLEHGVPLFLTQLADALKPASTHGTLHLVGAGDARQTITDSATLHGHDLLRNGFTVAQVVHGYGDVCQVVTEMATETNAAISASDFQVFNRCLDDAIAGAVTAYGRERERDMAYQGTERLGVFTHEMRSLVNTAVLSFDVIKKGMVGVGGSTGAIHARSLAGLTALVERSLAEVRLAAGTPALERVLIGEFMEELEMSAAMQADGHGLSLKVSNVGADVAVDADRQLLASAVSNLIDNAFKFSKAGGTVRLATHSTEQRVFIDVSDACGGLPQGKIDELFRPFARGESDRSGLGLGLTIALAATRANSGDLYVRDVPGVGCVFTIDLPRQPAPAGAIAQGLPEEQPGAFGGSGDGAGGGAHGREPKAQAH